jgi:hypothetical protein
MTRCDLVDRYERFGGSCCIFLKAGERLRPGLLTYFIPLLLTSLFVAEDLTRLMVE